MVFHVSQAERVLSGTILCLCINTSAAKLYPIVYRTLSLPGSNGFLNVDIECLNCEGNGSLMSSGVLRPTRLQTMASILAATNEMYPAETHSYTTPIVFLRVNWFVFEGLPLSACWGRLFWTTYSPVREGQRQGIDLLRGVLHPFTRHKVNFYVLS